jgi:hypothetical protein
MTADLQERLNVAIHKAVSRHRGAFTGSEIAEAIVKSDPDLWEEAREVLAREKLIAMANGILRGPLHQPNSAQLPLAGFEDIPKYIRVGRKWVEIQDANVEQVKEFTEWYRARVEKNGDRYKRDKTMLSNLERLIRIMARYDKNTPGISVSSVLEIREVRAELKALRVN